MRRRFLLVLIIIFFTFLFGVLFFLSTADDRERAALTFSATQSWDENIYNDGAYTPTLVPNADERITLPPPPANLSKETTSELRVLHELEAARTDAMIAEIEQERSLGATYFGPYRYRDIIDTEAHPETNVLIEHARPEFRAVLVRFKEHFDRVRPSYLDPTLTTTIEIPGHPAYPSGHASESMLIALILGDIDPENKNAYIESALRIAHNREIAGVHYPSDSATGQELARQYFSLLKDTNWYKEQLERARGEWE